MSVVLDLVKSGRTELFDEIKRFQSFADRTGRDKSSSYGVSFHFSPHFDDNDEVSIEVGGYNIGSWNRHHYVQSTGKTLYEDFKKLVDEADEITKYERWCPSCKEFTIHDPETGKCQGFNDWGDVHECNEYIEVQ